jgi:hypothetical protein
MGDIGECYKPSCQMKIMRNDEKEMIVNEENPLYFHVLWETAPHLTHQQRHFILL